MSHRRLLPALLTAACLLAATTAHAQSPGGKKALPVKARSGSADSAITEMDGPAGDSAATPARPATAQGTSDVDATTAGVDLTLEVWLSAGSDFSAAQIRQLRVRIKQRSDRMVDKLATIIEADPHNPQAAEWRFQQAELLFEIDALERQAQLVECDRRCRPPAGFAKSEAIYTAILRQHGDYARLDEVLYRKAQILVAKDQGRQAEPLLHRLADNYPNSKYVREARLILGDQLLAADRYQAAFAQYLASGLPTDHPAFGYLLYRLGWIAYHRGDRAKAVEKWKKASDKAKPQAKPLLEAALPADVDRSAIVGR